MKLKIAENLSLPVDAATQTLLIFGKRGSGKSSTATRFAEQLIAAAVPIAVLDPVDVWWGLKAGQDGQREGGLEVYVFGGAHRDLPLEPTGGVLAADTLVEHRINAVFVLREFSNKEKARFVSDFAERLFARNREAMHLFCEEAHEVMPQKPYVGEEEMLGRMTRLQKLGRTSGIGLTSITQRPASLNTNARTQAEILITHRILGPHDRDAIDEWIKFHNVQGERQTVMETIASLKTGEAWVWAPDFPEDRPIGLKRVSMLLPETFDSRRTPKPGEKAKQPKALAPVDLEKLRSKMAATIEKAKADDPRELRKQIAELKKQLGAATTQVGRKPSEVVTAKVVEKFVLKDGQLARLEKLYERIFNEAERHAKAIDLFWKQQSDEAKALLNVLAMVAGEQQPFRPADVVPIRNTQATATQRVVRASPPRPAAGVITRPQPRVSPAESNGNLPPAKQKILNGLAFLHGIGVAPADKTQLALLVGVSPTSGGYFNNLGSLRSDGLIEYPTGGTVALTDAGLAQASTEGVPTTTDELHDAIRAKLPPAKWKILDALIAAYPDAVSKDALAEQLGVSPASGGYFNNLGSLRSLGLIDYPRPGTVAAKPVLFLE